MKKYRNFFNGPFRQYTTAISKAGLGAIIMATPSPLMLSLSAIKSLRMEALHELLLALMEAFIYSLENSSGTFQAEFHARDTNSPTGISFRLHGPQGEALIFNLGNGLPHSIRYSPPGGLVPCTLRHFPIKLTDEEFKACFEKARELVEKELGFR